MKGDAMGDESTHQPKLERKIRVYVAAPWINKDLAATAQEQLEAEGFEVTSHWIKHHSDAVLGNPADFKELRTQALEDVEDIIKSDLFLIMNTGVTSEGKATELGLAYALSIPIVLVGPRLINIFYYLGGIEQCDSLEEAITVIKDGVKEYL